MSTQFVVIDKLDHPTNALSIEIEERSCRFDLDVCVVSQDRTTFNTVPITKTELLEMAKSIIRVCVIHADMETDRQVDELHSLVDEMRCIPRSTK